MKRLTLLTILLVVVGLTAGFAAPEVKPSITLSGSGTVQWGIDLDTMATGFLNSFASDVTVTLVAADSSVTKAGTEGFYGSITISDVDLVATLSNGTPWWTMGGASVAATIVGMGGNLVIGVFDAPDLAADFVAALEADADAADDVIDDESAGDVGVDYGTYGTFVSYTLSEALMVGVEVVSEADWTANTAQAYAFALDVQAKFAPLTINAAVNYGVNYAADVLGAGIKVAADLDMLDAWVGFDAQVTGGFAFDVGAGIDLTLMETVTAGVDVVYGDAFDDLDVVIAFDEPGAAGLVEGLDASLDVYLLDIAGLAGLEYEIVFAAGYDAGKLYPHFGVTYGDANDLAASLTAYVHVDYDLFETAATTLSVGWDSGDLLAATPVLGTATVGVTVSY